MARTTPRARAEIVRRALNGTPVRDIAQAFGVSRPTVYKWIRRHREGDAALLDRRSVARAMPHKISFEVERLIERLRRTKRLVAWQIAEALKISRSTVLRALKRMRLSRLRSLDLPMLVQRYEYRNPGELVHIDIKKLPRFRFAGHRIHGDRKRRNLRVGYEHAYVCVDDATRLAYVELRPHEDRFEASGFLRAAAVWFSERGIHFQRVMTDNGRVFLSHLFRDALADLAARHIRTRPYSPQTNGKAERFIRTLLSEWAYGIAFTDADERAMALPAWLRYYNEERPHSALKMRPPALRAAAVNNPGGLYT